MTEIMPRSAVVALTADLMFGSKISGAARARGVACLLVRDTEELIARTREASPRLVLVDFSHPGADWESLLPRLGDLLAPHQGNLVAFTTHVSWKSTRPYHKYCHQVLTQEALAQELPALLVSPAPAKDSAARKVEVLRLGDLRRELEETSRELACRVSFREERYESGVIAFHPLPDTDPKQIVHRDRDVLGQVIAGCGRLRLHGVENEQTVTLEEGNLVRVPAGVPHDFAATGREDLVLWYTLIAVGS